MNNRIRRPVPSSVNRLNRPVLRQRFTLYVPWLLNDEGMPSLVTIENLVTDGETHDVDDLQEAGWVTHYEHGLYIHTRIIS